MLIDLRPSQQQLGNTVGLSRESLNKHLRQWRDTGLIRIENGYFVITDLEAMERL